MDTVEILTMLDAIIHDCEKAKKALLRTGKGKVAGFEKFWSLYPLKDDEAAARREWEISVQESDVEKIYAALKKAVWPAERRYIPTARRWLWRKRWLSQKVGEDHGKYKGLSESL